MKAFVHSIICIDVILDLIPKQNHLINKISEGIFLMCCQKGLFPLNLTIQSLCSFYFVNCMYFSKHVLYFNLCFECICKLWVINYQKLWEVALSKECHSNKSIIHNRRFLLHSSQAFSEILTRFTHEQSRHNILCRVNPTFLCCLRFNVHILWGYTAHEQRLLRILVCAALDEST